MLPSVADIGIDQGGSPMEIQFEQGDGCNKLSNGDNKCIQFLPPTLVQKENENLVSKLGSAMASGLIVTIMIYSVGHISGAHMNPVVTISFAIVGHFSWKQVPAYIGAQLGGAIAACFTLGAMFSGVSDIGTTKPSGPVLQALIMEIIVSFLLMFINSAVATDASAAHLRRIYESSKVAGSSIDKQQIHTFLDICDRSPCGNNHGCMVLYLRSPHRKTSAAISLRHLSSFSSRIDLDKKFVLSDEAQKI